MEGGGESKIEGYARTCRLDGAHQHAGGKMRRKVETAEKRFIKRLRENEKGEAEFLQWEAPGKLRFNQRTRTA